jgi:hypothetical protein
MIQSMFGRNNYFDEKPDLNVLFDLLGVMPFWSKKHLAKRTSKKRPNSLKSLFKNRAK